MNDDVKAARESIKEFRDWAQRLNQLARYSEDGMTHSLIAADNQRAIEVKTKALLAHIDGEPARIAAKGEEVREACARRVPSIGQPHDCFEAVRTTPLTATPLADALRLANENIVKMAQASTEAQASAAEGVRYWTDLAQAEARDAAALRARVAELEAAANTAGADASAAALRAMARATNAEAERDGWRKEANRWPELLAQAVAERDARFDCKGGPGTTSPACGGCATCLHRVIEGVEVERDMLQTALRDNSAAHSETGKALLRAEAQVEAARAECARVHNAPRCMNAYDVATDVRRAMDEAKP